MSLTIKEYGEAVFTNYYMTTLGEINSTLFELSEVTSDHISLSFTYKGPPLGEKIATNDVLKQVFYGAFTSAGSLVGVDSLAALGQVGFTGVVLSSNLYVNEVMWEEVKYGAGVSFDLILKAANETSLDALNALYAGDDVFIISKEMQSGHNDINGYGGNDTFYGTRAVSANADVFIGGEGQDHLIVDRAFDSYQIQASNTIWNAVAQRGELEGFIISDVTNATNRIQVSEVERFHFSDINLALDTGKGEIAGSAYRLYKAAFDRLPEAEGLGFWINSLDQGADLVNVAQGFINSDEFRVMYGANPTDQQFVTLLYNHVLHRPPEGEGYQFWLNSLSAGVSRAQVLKDFSESTENINQTAELIANGIQYEPWIG